MCVFARLVCLRPHRFSVVSCSEVSVALRRGSWPPLASSNESWHALVCRLVCVCVRVCLFVTFAPTCHTIWQPRALLSVHRGSRAQWTYNNAKLALTFTALLSPGSRRLPCAYMNLLCGSAALYICKQRVGEYRLLLVVHFPDFQPSVPVEQERCKKKKWNALQGSLNYKRIKYHFNVHNPSHVCIPYLLSFQLEKNAL